MLPALTYYGLSFAPGRPSGSRTLFPSLLRRDLVPVPWFGWLSGWLSTIVYLRPPGVPARGRLPTLQAPVVWLIRG
jgi:hypothetical protein